MGVERPIRVTGPEVPVFRWTIPYDGQAPFFLSTLSVGNPTPGPPSPYRGVLGPELHAVNTRSISGLTRSRAATRGTPRISSAS